MTGPQGPFPGYTGMTGPQGYYPSYVLGQSMSMSSFFSLSLSFTYLFSGLELYKRLVTLSNSTQLQLSENINSFDVWAESFVSNLVKKGINFLVFDEVQRDIEFVDRFISYLAKQKEKNKLRLVILGTPPQGLLKVEVGANIESRSAFVTIPSLNVVEVYSLLSEYKCDVLIDAWTLLNGNPRAYHDFLLSESGINVADFLSRQRDFLKYLTTSLPLPSIPNDILQDLNKTSKLRSDFPQVFQETIQKLITRNIIVCKAPFREYVKDRNCKLSHIGFSHYFLTTAAAVQINREKLLNPSDWDLGLFMKSHSGLALEDAFEDFYSWLILTYPDILLPGLFSKASEWNVLRNVSFAGVGSDCDMVLESKDPSLKMFALFYIKKQASELFNVAGMNTFLKAFAELPELQGHTLYVLLSFLVAAPFPTDWLQSWQSAANIFKKVTFIISPDIIDFYSEISKFPITKVDGLLPRRYLHDELNSVLKIKSIVRLQGRNQVGKTTFIKQFLEEKSNHLYLEL